MPYCAVPGCRSLRGREKVSFHQIPSDLERRDQWLKAIDRHGLKGSQWIPNQYDAVCAKHFTLDDFKGEGKIILLKKTAIPTVFEDSPASKLAVNSGTSVYKVHRTTSKTKQKLEVKSKERHKSEVISTHATNILRMWLFQHTENPYPTTDEKFQLALETSLTLIQVNKWFNYARKRILESMLDPATNYKRKKGRLPDQKFPSSILPNVQNSSGSDDDYDGEYKAPLVVMLKQECRDD